MQRKQTKCNLKSQPSQTKPGRNEGGATLILPGAQACEKVGSG